MPRAPVPTWWFALVVVRRGDRFLVVKETKDHGRWYLPAGRVEPGETPAQAAVRETLEEAGIDVVLEGVLRVEASPTSQGMRCRVVFLGRAVGDPTPKSVPDHHSLGAAWVTLAELDGLQLRDVEVRRIFEHVASGGIAHPLSLLATEGAAWPASR